jgi:hypothetical protein
MSSIASQLSFSTSTSLVGGAAGSLPYQSATSSTAMLAIGSAGTILTVSAGLPAWTAQSNLTSGNASYLASSDDRIKAPSDDNAGALRFGFTAFNNNNTSPYGDYLHMRSYTDGTGGLDNFIVFRKDTFGIRQYQQTWGSATAYATFRDVAMQQSTASFTILNVGSTYSGGSTGEIRAAGEITAYYTSDERLKENVHIISNPIERLEQIRGVEFDWTDTYLKERGGEDEFYVRKHDVGVIAQEIEKVLPEVVATRENGYKAVKYEKIVPLLIECIKEQQKQINQILQELQDLTRK